MKVVYPISSMISPFSGKHYSRNADAGGNRNPCCICGREVRPGNEAAMLYVAGGGRDFVSSATHQILFEEADAGIMGSFPIGSDCWRKHKAELAQYL